MNRSTCWQNDVCFSLSLSQKNKFLFYQNEKHCFNNETSAALKSALRGKLFAFGAVVLKRASKKKENIKIRQRMGWGGGGGWGGEEFSVEYMYVNKYMYVTSCDYKTWFSCNLLL